MTRPDTFTFRISQAERGLLEQLAESLQRSQSDALRWLIREAVRGMDALVEDGAGDYRPVEVQRATD